MRPVTFRPRVTRRFVDRSLLAVALVAVVVAVGVLSPRGGRTVEAVAGGTLGAGGEFQAVVPTRILDTRSADAGPLSGLRRSAPVGSAPEIVVPVVGEGGLPEFTDADDDGFDDDVLAVVLNITVIDPTLQGHIRAFGTGTPEGTTSVVNFVAGDRVPNTAIIRPGVDGAVSLRLVTPAGVGSAHVAIDVTGWYSTSAYADPGARTVTVEPTRIYDSRVAAFAPAPSGAAWQRELPVRGAVQMDAPTRVVVPDDPDVVGVILNVTGVNERSGAQPTFVSLLADPVASADEVGTSNLNLPVGQRRANLAIVPVPDDGTLTMFNRFGSIDLVIDVVGYLLAGSDPTTTTGRLVPLVAPFRVLDTRLPEHGSQPLTEASAEDWNFDDFVEDVRVNGEWVGEQQGLFGNLTATGLSRRQPWFPPARTFLTAYPSPADRDPPLASNLNLGEGVSVPNLALLRYGPATMEVDGNPVPIDNGVAVFNRAGFVHYLLDVYAVILA